MKSPFCYIKLHNWKYTKEKHTILDHPKGLSTVRVLVRECKYCGHREHHLLPREDGKLNQWESFDHINKDSIINYKQL